MSEVKGARVFQGKSGATRVELRLLKSSIMFHRVFSHICECPMCGGLLFNFLDTTVNLEEMSDNHDLLSDLWMALIDGESWEDIEADENTPVNYDEWDSCECASCDYKSDSPQRGGS